jgi:RNA polymerase primary sigma factor
MAMDDKLVDGGKGNGYPPDNEVNDLIPHDVHCARDADDLLAAVRTQGLKVLEDEPLLPYSALEQELAKAAEDIDLNPAPGAPEAANDPVRAYLREMGAVPLLTRQGEVDIAKRIERGQLSVLKALSRSSIVIHQVLAIGQELKRGLRSIEETVIFDEEEITEEIRQQRVTEITRRIDELHKRYKTARRLAGQLATVPAEKKAREYLRCRWQLDREIVRTQGAQDHAGADLAGDAHW